MVLTVAASSGILTIGDVYNGDTKLTKDTHYTITAATGKVTLKTAYLATLTEGEEHNIIIETSQGDGAAIVAVVDTTEE